MRLTFRPSLLLLVPLPLAAQRAPSPAPIRYEIAFPNAAHHEAEVSVTFAGVPARPLEVRMSRSSPGRYALHEFAKNVYNVKATDSRGRELVISQPSPHQWNVAGHDGTVRVTLHLFGDRADGTYAGIDRGMAHLNIPATLAWARGMEGRAARVTFRLPDPTWTIATQLFPTSDSTTFTAPNMQYLMDSPVHLGAQSWHMACRVERKTYTMRVALHHLGPARTRIAMWTPRSASWSRRPRWPGTPRLRRRDLHVPVDVLVGCRGRHGAPQLHLAHQYRVARLSMNGLLGTARTSSSTPGTWSASAPGRSSPLPSTRRTCRESCGSPRFTSYYGPLVPARGDYRRCWLRRHDGGGGEPRVECPRAPLFLGGADEPAGAFTDAAVSIDPQNKGNTFISYYPFGEAIALALDLTLRARGKTLDDFMQEMWKVHGAQRSLAPVRPYTVTDARRALARVSGDSAFARDFFARYIEGREAAPYGELLRQGGYVMRPTPRCGLPATRRCAMKTAGDGAGVTPIGTPIYATERTGATGLRRSAVDWPPPTSPRSLRRTSLATAFRWSMSRAGRSSRRR
jgi:hypothetical protein